MENIITKFNNLDFGKEAHELFVSLDPELKKNKEVILSAIKNSCKDGDYVSSTVEILSEVENLFKGDFEIMSTAMEKDPMGVVEIYSMADYSLKKNKEFFKVAISNSDDTDELIDELFETLKSKSKMTDKSNNSRNLEVKSEGGIFSITLSHKNGKTSTRVFDSEGREYQRKARSLLRLKVKELNISETGYIYGEKDELTTHEYFNRVYKSLKG